ncbi:cob(I)yrinic acid a,c-diamide adenosyltransferase [Actinomycetes bacterium]|nr:cob(I)yrinic acid a,c-diamide adenosyltransferase [Actinomycetes bacterium]
MVNLTKIYTRTGDDGTTSLGDMSRTGKNDPRLKAYADVDEANCTIGVVLAATDVPAEVRALLLRIQNDLFDVGADLCTPVVDNPAHEPLRVTQAYVDFLEQACDQYNDQLEPLRSFILPGGTSAAAQLHVARTVARRAERSIWAALDTYHGGMNPLAATYVNRLSDLLFILARFANLHAGGDVLWKPGANR